MCGARAHADPLARVRDLRLVLEPLYTHVVREVLAAESDRDDAFARAAIASQFTIASAVSIHGTSFTLSSAIPARLERADPRDTALTSAARADLADRDA